MILFERGSNSRKNREEKLFTFDNRGITKLPTQLAYISTLHIKMSLTWYVLFCQVAAFLEYREYNIIIPCLLLYFDVHINRYETLQFIQLSSLLVLSSISVMHTICVCMCCLPIYLFYSSWNCVIFVRVPFLIF